MSDKLFALSLGILIGIFLSGCQTSGTKPSQPGPSSGTQSETAGPSGDVTGTWLVTSLTEENTNSRTFYLTQRGADIEGRSMGGETIMGTIRGNTIEMRRGEGIGWVVYTGTFDGKTMSGQWNSADGYYVGSWNARIIK